MITGPITEAYRRLAAQAAEFELNLHLLCDALGLRENKAREEVLIDLAALRCGLLADGKALLHQARKIRNKVRHADAKGLRSLVAKCPSRCRVGKIAQFDHTKPLKPQLDAMTMGPPIGAGGREPVDELGWMIMVTMDGTVAMAITQLREATDLLRELRGLPKDEAPA